MGVSKLNLWRSSKDYFCITLGMAIYAIGFCAFIVPEDVVIGGLAGVGTILWKLTGIDIAIWQFVINIMLLAIAYKVVGKQFVLGTIFGVTMISFFVGLFQPMFHYPLTSEPFMNIVIGGIMCGFGVGLPLSTTAVAAARILLQPWFRSIPMSASAA